MKQKRNENTTTQFTMRINNSLYEVIKQNAVKFKRSIAKQIEFMLEQAVESKN